MKHNQSKPFKVKMKSDGNYSKRHQRMKPLILLSFFILNVIAFSTGLKAQNTISSAGGELSGANGKASFTAGQVFFQSYTGENGSVSEGIQQPYEIFVATNVDDLLQIDLETAAYPNPVSDKLNLKLESVVSETFVYHLFNINGGLLESESIISSNTEISMDGRVPGVYFLKVTDNGREIKTFKIVKY